MKFRFFNTFEPVIPLYRLLLPHLEQAGHEAEAWIVEQRYRPAEAGGGYPLRRIRSLANRSHGRLQSKALIHLSYAVASAILSLLGSRVDRNVFLTQPPLFTSWARVLRTVRRQPYCIVTMDLYPWVAIEAGILRRGSLAARVAERIAKVAFRGADRVIVIGRCMAQRVEDLGVPEQRIHLIRNWTDTTAIRPIPRAENRLRSRHGLDGTFVVMYSGNLGVSHRFGDLLETADRLREEPNLRFLFVGDGARKAEVEEEVNRRHLHNVTLLPFQPYEALSESLSMGDLHFVSLRSGFEGLVVPSKAYGVLAAGRPILYQGSRRGEIARMVDEEEVGIVVEPGDVDGLAAAILRARDDGDWRSQAGRRARRVAESRYDAGRALHLYEDVLTGLIEDEGTADG